MNGIIFDLDGVIVFTDILHYKAWKCVADKLNIPFDEEINHRLRGVSRAESFEIILEKAVSQPTEAEKARFLDEKNSLYCEFLKTLTPDSIEDSTRATLRELRKRGYKLAIGSSSRNSATILKYTALTDYFDAVSDGNNITNSKPHPEVFNKAAEYLKLSPNICAVVEDAEAGIDAAKAGGFYAIGIGTAANYSKTDRGIESLTDLLNIFN